MNSKEILVSQLKACHDQDTWFVSLHSALQGLTEEQATSKNNGISNTIHEIVNHLIYYNLRYLNRLKGLPNAKGHGNNDETYIRNEQRSWQSSSEMLDQIMSEWVESVQQAEENTLEQWISDITHLTIHTAYHIGQIVHIRKEQGSWNPSNGVH